MSYRHKHIKPKIRNLKPKKKFFTRAVFWVILGFLTMITLAYFGLFWQKLQVSEIKIYGNTLITSADIENITKESVNRKIFTAGIFTISSKSILLVNKESIVKNILSALPRASEVSIKKKLPKSLILTINERQPFAVFCGNLQDCFLMDDNGVVFEKIKDAPEKMFIVRHGEYVKNSVLGRAVIEKSIIDSIDKIAKNLQNNFQIGVKETIVSNPIIIKTSENWDIHFNPALNIDDQIIKLNTLLRDEISENTRKSLQYIYLQYKNRAYYK